MIQATPDNLLVLLDDLEDLRALRRTLYVLELLAASVGGALLAWGVFLLRRGTP